MNLIDHNTTFGENAEGLYLQRSQEIPDDFLRTLADFRAHSAQNRAKDWHLAAMVPTVFVEKWLREGFNFFEAPLKDCVARIKAEGLDYFMATEKAL